MVNGKTRMAIKQIDEITNELDTFSLLGTVLAGEYNIWSLKTLELITLARDCNLLNKEMDINKVYIKDGKNQNILGNLLNNPQNIALQFLEYLIQNYDADFSTCLDSTGYSIFTNWVLSFAHIEKSTDSFYKRYDMIDKKIDIITDIVSRNFLDQTNKDFLFTAFDCAISNERFSPLQRERMKSIIRYMDLSEQLATILDPNLLSKVKYQMLPYKASNLQNIEWETLNLFEVDLKQSAYIEEELPKLVKKIQ